MSENWDAAEEIEIPKGAFIGWGNNKGQHVTGKVIEYGDLAGEDTKGNACPQVTVELIEPAASFDKLGARTDYPAGELVSLTCSQVQLKRGIKAADPSPGDLIRIVLEDVRVLPNNGNTLKEYGIKIKRGAGGPVAAPASASAGFGGTADDSTPPF
ncbi:hypothetical protein ACM0AZ_15160 [Mycobacteroides abscessus subsp. massiliense]|uniref:Uncharacterized protein n=1 Tax=Mycobacteroides immunogenum TaxID=83262 RepID=A0A7V8LJH9_9MYCO|nr:hypothetical protein [Mycobacteroides immunogenum]AMT71955.1 hypothetical protein ABG82_18310 [Mycobacteroides immunogenum]ANO05087.1 hypothetical protein BAB75_18595 [Mycobacteroides immunogenum]KIU40239.1 hypothetical protein TL11_13370 [Mycobacteroides immunogenum]KPG02851.1 hypothetical protein AN909_26460 [Mycobacteroides immunogenum]KPG02938.1 hypothetical protein AN908_26910 [Mycobacteroides immunogenum]